VQHILGLQIFDSKCGCIDLDLNNAMITYTLKDTNLLHKSRICCKEEIKNIGITS